MEKIERRISGEKRHDTMDRIVSSQNPDDHKTVCPYCTVKTALCIAALESVMTDRRNCFSAGYNACSIFLVNESRGR
jgi:hypothetical protein